MAITYRKAATITGSANSTVFDDGLTSTSQEQRLLKSLTVSLSGQAGNLLEVWLENEKICDIYDYSLDTHEASGTNMYKSVMKLVRLELNIPIPAGQTVKVGMNCGATAKNAFIAYEYEVTG